MKRRDFIRRSALGVGAVVLGDKVHAQLPEKRERVETPLKVAGYVKEPAREIPLIANADVVVVGGGPAGVAAAIGAARGGVSVILLERYGFLGGLWTGGMVLPILNTRGVDKSNHRRHVVKGVMTDIVERLLAMNMAVNPDRPVVDPEASKLVVQEMMDEAGVQVIYHSCASQLVKSGDRIEAIIMETKSGRVAVSGKMFIDGTGDGDVFCWAGEPFRKQLGQIGGMWRIGNVPNLQAHERLPQKNVRLMWMGGEDNQDGLDVLNLSRLQHKIRREMWQEVEKIRQEEGMEEAFLMDTPSQIGVRTTRVLEARYMVSLEESMKYTSYADVIGMSGGSAPIKYKDKWVQEKERPMWQIPYRSLVPKLTPNLLVAGRCFGFTEDLTYDAREIATCFVTGQAAGTAAGIAIKNRCAVGDVDVAQLQRDLKAQHVMLE